MKLQKQFMTMRLNLQHAKGKLIKAEKGLDGIGIPVHPGAQKYFDEVNKK